MTLDAFQYRSNINSKVGEGKGRALDHTGPTSNKKLS